MRIIIETRLLWCVSEGLFFTSRHIKGTCCCSPGLLPLYICVVFQRVCSMLFLIFFLFGFLSTKSVIFLLQFLSDFKGILGALWQHCFPVYCPFATEGSSMLNSYGDGLNSGCSAGVRLSLICRGSIMCISFQFCILFKFFNFLCTISY